jgi:hypothetical protein
MLRYWYYAVPPLFLAVILWAQPADRIVMIAANDPPPGYPLRQSCARWLTDDCDTLAYVLRAENAARGRKAGVVGPGWFEKATGFRAYGAIDPDKHELRDAPFEPVEVDSQREYEEVLDRPGQLRDRYFLEYPPLALYLFRLGLIGAPGDGAEVHPAILDGHQFYVGCHPPRAELPGEVAVYARFRHALRIYAVLMTLAQLGLMLLIDFGLPRPSPTWLLILPGFLYNTPCRFDVLPAMLVMASIVAADRRRVAVSGLCLGLAVALKMYPLVLAPILLRFTARSWKDAIVWCACAAVPVVLSYAAMYLTDGVEGATIPFKYQLSRDPEPEWCFYGRFLPPALAVKTPAMSALRTLIPLLVSVLLCLRRPPDVFSLLRRCVIALLVFLTLSVFFSPQWWQWLAVLLVPLAGRHRWLVPLVVVLDLWTFLHFPVLFDSIAKGNFGDSVDWVRDVHVLVRAQLWFAVGAACAWAEVRDKSPSPQGRGEPIT